MRFCNLPVEMNVGGAHLKPVDEPATLKDYTCFSCDRMSLSVFVCSEQHVLCKVCCVPELGPHKKIWCPVCCLAVNVHEARFSAKTLGKLQFECACGFRGTLVGMKIHLLETPTSSKSQGVCGGEVGRTQSLATANETKEDLNDRMRNLAIEEIEKMKQAMLDEMTRKFDNDHISERLRQQVNELRESNQALLSMIHRLEDKASAQDRTLEQCKKDTADTVSTNASTPTAFLWFNFEELFQHYRTTRERKRSPSQSTVVAGVYFKVFIGLENRKDEDFLGVYFIIKKRSKRDPPVPFDRKLIVSILDVNGMTVATKMIYKSGQKEQLGAWVAIPNHHPECSGHPRVITVNSVREKCLVGEMIRVSAQVSPIE